MKEKRRSYVVPVLTVAIVLVFALMVSAADQKVRMKVPGIT